MASGATQLPLVSCPSCQSRAVAAMPAAVHSCRFFTTRGHAVSHLDFSPAVGRRPAGFSLIELLAVVAILGVLVSLSLPAVQGARESSRRTACTNNLRQMGVALLNYESARRWFPPGSDSYSRRDHAWSSFILPYLDEGKTAARIDYARPWNDPQGNATLSDLTISTYVCPTGTKTFEGKQDYGGVMGSAVRLAESDLLPLGFERGGVLFATSDDWRRPCRAAEVSDGLSRTLLVTEGVDRGTEGWDSDARIGNARWACGTNCFLLSSPVLNTPDVDGFRSHHLGGVNGLFGDGRVVFLADEAGPEVLMAICTKAGGEPAAYAP